MSSYTLCAAIEDTRFKGAKRLCWFAFGDCGGVTGLASVMKWANCDADKAERLLDWFCRNGHAYRSDGLYVAHELLALDQADRGYTAPNARPSRKPISRSTRDKVFARDGEVCAYCGTTDGPFHLDHVLPLSRGGCNSDHNLTVACAPCNISKRNRTPEEWGGRK